jgi:hypothetical protein
VVWRGTNEGGGWRVVKDQNRSALGGHSPVITTIGHGECTHRSLLNPCQDVHGGPSRRRGPRWVAGNGSREGCVSGTTTWLPRSADGSLTFLLGRFAQSVDAPAESHLHGRQLNACMDMGGAGWGALSEAAQRPLSSAPSTNRGVLTRYGRASARYCTIVLQPPRQTFNSSIAQVGALDARRRALVCDPGIAFLALCGTQSLETKEGKLYSPRRESCHQQPRGEDCEKMWLPLTGPGGWCTIKTLVTVSRASGPFRPTNHLH